MDAGAEELTRVDATVDALAAALAAAGDPNRAAAMARYMKDHFAFFGVPTPERRAIQREVLERWRPEESELVAFVDAAWARPERELQYAACDVVAQSASRCSPAFIADLERWITHRSWWDTVDALSHGVSAVIDAHPETVDVMDRWIESDNFWLARVAIIHQLGRKTTTDAGRLFRYCARRAGDTEFFIRRAIGWALREYSKTDPDRGRVRLGSRSGAVSVVPAQRPPPDSYGLTRRHAHNVAPTGSTDARRSTL